MRSGIEAEREVHDLSRTPLSIFSQPFSEAAANGGLLNLHHAATPDIDAEWLPKRAILLGWEYRTIDPDAPVDCGP
ncbi:MAG: hypothetical protein DRH70_05585 [Candidatus Coatesbacteria bacterium]|nr:MAG: hypothetical protein DRH70_05585 [Candidatus Coatesbacteria bacterium]